MKIFRVGRAAIRHSGPKNFSRELFLHFNIKNGSIRLSKKLVNEVGLKRDIDNYLKILIDKSNLFVIITNTKANGVIPIYETRTVKNGFNCFYWRACSIEFTELVVKYFKILENSRIKLSKCGDKVYELISDKEFEERNKI